MVDSQISADDQAVHFNLGTDKLASAEEIVDMHDPWPAVEPVAAEHVDAHVHMPEGDFGALTDPRQLPGV